jgi:hypothetical protein
MIFNAGLLCERGWITSLSVLAKLAFIAQVCRSLQAIAWGLGELAWIHMNAGRVLQKAQWI